MMGCQLFKLTPFVLIYKLKMFFRRREKWGESLANKRKWHREILYIFIGV
jgi:hypothetical protein